MKKQFLFFFLILPFETLFSQEYFPPAGSWDKRSATLSFDTAKLNDAIRFAIASENKNPRNMELSHQLNFGKEPFSESIGAYADRGDPTGLIIHHGYIVAEWGEPSRVDMTHSVTKSFLSTVVGLAVDKGKIKSVQDKVSAYVNEVEVYDSSIDAFKKIIRPFASDHNKKLTWEVMLRQTSDWEGTLWGKPEWADRPDKDSTKWIRPVRNKPGTVFEYNDVRVNALALAATMVWQRALPDVLKEKIMNPIGASDTWKWHGYTNSWIILDKKPVQSASGGGHWGGGLFINAYDMARFGLLTLHKGRWKEKQLISQQWINQATTPTPAKQDYGYMNFFLNTDKKMLPAAPATAFVHIGNGTNMIYVDAEHDIVMVVRWIENNAMAEMVKKMLDALK
ncbi:MAG TPA: serine hydrolase [Chitinophagaceae bacterium]